jgi:hypothetical protein
MKVMYKRIDISLALELDYSRICEALPVGQVELSRSAFSTSFRAQFHHQVTQGKPLT